jgi:5-methylthioadenosine/S-adenosylhomocysteine deaminase
MAPMADPYTALVSFAQPTNIDTVVVDGRILRRGGAFTTLDYAEVLNQAAECARSLAEKAKWV